MADTNEAITILEDELKKEAKSKNVLIMTFIAPDSIVRKSPVTYDYATIKVEDLYEIEKNVEELNKRDILRKKLHLIIQTPGGNLYIATKIAKYLQQCFEEIESYVAYEAASAGTLLCLTAKTTTMDKAGNLTPIDPQVTYKSQRISSSSYEQAIKDFKKEFGNQRPEEISSPFQQIGVQFDPIVRKEMNKKTTDMIYLSYKLLVKSQNAETEEEKKRIVNLVFRLVDSDDWPHDHVITLDEAINLGFNIDNSEEKLKTLRLYKKYVSSQLKEPQANHIIKFFYPINEKKPKEATKTTEK